MQGAICRMKGETSPRHWSCPSPLPPSPDWNNANLCFPSPLHSCRGAEKAPFQPPPPRGSHPFLRAPTWTSPKRSLRLFALLQTENKLLCYRRDMRLPPLPAFSYPSLGQNIFWGVTSWACDSSSSFPPSTHRPPGRRPVGG